MVVFLIHWLVVALGLAAAAYLVPGVTVASGSALAMGALVLGFVNAVVKPVLTLLTLPLTVCHARTLLFRRECGRFRPGRSPGAGVFGGLVLGGPVRRPGRQPGVLGGWSVLQSAAINPIGQVGVAPGGRGRLTGYVRHGNPERSA